MAAEGTPHTAQPAILARKKSYDATCSGVCLAIQFTRVIWQQRVLPTLHNQQYLQGRNLMVQPVQLPVLQFSSLE